MFAYKTLDDFEFNGKTVILRADLNSDFANKKLIESERIKESAKTISELKKKKAKVVIIAHQGRKGERDFASLRQHSKFLNKYTKVKYVNDIAGEKAVNEIKNLKPGEALLLENIRYLDDELNPEKKGNKIIKTLMPLADIYINDAFSNSHRNHTSMTAFPKFLSSGIGRVMQKEIEALEKIRLKDSLYILGGAKPEDNIKLLKHNNVLACGLFGQLCIIARGKNLGAQNRYLKTTLYMTKELKPKLNSKVYTPIDFAVKINGKREEILLENFPSKYEIFDIGQLTINKFIEEIKQAKSIYMKGPAGFCADKNFCKGTFSILKAISENRNCFSVIGGGHLNDAIKHSGIDKNKFNHISLSGGALLNFLAGEKLPGLEALRRGRI
ncbi:MAG: phosphoglycerate kinase [Nanoarchaeota archaeon]